MENLMIIIVDETKWQKCRCKIVLASERSNACWKELASFVSTEK
jgi:hypothetical protein